MVRCQALTYKGRLICIVNRRVHGKMADPVEIVFDDDLVKTKVNDILLYYLEMQGRLSSDEDASDEDESSSGNDSDIGRAIRAEIVGKSGVEPPRHRRYTRPAASLKSQVVSLQTAHSWANAGVLLGDACIGSGVAFEAI